MAPLRRLLLPLVAAIASQGGWDPRSRLDHFEYATIETATHDGSSVRLQGLERHPRVLRVHVMAFGERHTIEAQHNAELFRNGYKEADLDGKGRISSVREGRTDCYYAGGVSGPRGDGMAFFSTCGGGVSGIVRHEEGGFELHFLRDQEAHIAFSLDEFEPEKPFKCGLDHGHGVSANGSTADAAFVGNDGKSFQFRPSSHDHDHGHGHRSRLGHIKDAVRRSAALQTAGECDAGGTKYVDVLLTNDYTRAQIRGQDTESISAAMFAYVAAAYWGGSHGGFTFPGVTDGQRFKCKIKLRLVGQLTWRIATPYYLAYYSGYNCGARCYTGDVCGPSEYSATCLLGSWGYHLTLYKPYIENIFGPVDNFPLLSEVDFNGGVMGLAYLGSMCDGGYSMNIVQVDSPSLAFNAMILVHEMGHNFYMEHDTGPGYFMNPYVQTGVVTSWSTESESYIAQYMNELYGGSGSTAVPKCLENDAGPDQWKRSICGNGILDLGEECDPGFDAAPYDSCCLGNCTLKTGCQCSVFDACCTSTGQFKPSGTTCRASTGECDDAETCTGVGGLCPVDVFAEPGRACSNPIWNTSATEAGVCYRKTCVGVADACGPERPYPLNSSSAISGDAFCGQNLTCRSCSGCSPSDPNYSESVYSYPRIGTRCGDGSMCTGTAIEHAQPGRCVNASAFKVNRWVVSHSPCSVTCRAENGSAVSDALCEEDPPFMCNTTAPTASPLASALTPTASPAAAASPTGSPSRAPRTVSPATQAPATASPSTNAPGTQHPGTSSPATQSPIQGSAGPSASPATGAPATGAPLTPTVAPATVAPATDAPTDAPVTPAPVTTSPSGAPSSTGPTSAPATESPSVSPSSATPSRSPATVAPSPAMVRRYEVIVLVRGAMSQITAAVQTQIRDIIATILRVSASQLTLYFAPGSVVVRVQFNDIMSNPPPLVLAQRLSATPLANLTAALNRTVESVGLPLVIVESSAGGSGDGSDGAASTGALVGAVFGAIAGVAGIACLAYVARRNGWCTSKVGPGGRAEPIQMEESFGDKNDAEVSFVSPSQVFRFEGQGNDDEQDGSDSRPIAVEVRKGEWTL